MNTREVARLLHSLFPRASLGPPGVIGPSTYGMERAIVEYDLSSLPSDEGLHAAELYIFWSAWGHAGSSFPTVHVYGYHGDNTATAADATRLSNELTTYTINSNTPSFMTLPLPVTFVHDSSLGD